MEDVAMNSGFWTGKRVLVTGHTGFKGSWLSLWLQELGADVTGYALIPPTKPSLFNVADIASGMKSVIGDVRDAESVLRLFASAQPEIVFHLAAQPLVRHSYLHPVETFSTNVMGLVNVFEAIRQTTSVRSVVNVTSDKCYENQEWLWGYRENEPMGGHDPYSSSKGCAELVTAAYRNSYFQKSRCAEREVALASARAGNVIGGGDWALDRLIPDIMRAIIDGRPVTIRNPQAVRPWQHVLEPLSGYLKLAERLYLDGDAFAQGWNFGPREVDARPVKWIVENLTRMWGEGAAWELQPDSSGLHEASHLKLDCSKAASQLDWHPRWQLQQALEKIVAWHQCYRDGGDMRALTRSQITEYSEL